MHRASSAHSKTPLGLRSTHVFPLPHPDASGGAKRLPVVAAFACLGLLPMAGSAAEKNCSGTVYLTFDTGNMSQAETIARILSKEQVKATFFLANEKTFRGDHALDPAWRDYWRARVAEGHAFGNHTFRHVYLKRDLPDGKLLARVTDGPEIRLDERGFCAELTNVDQTFQALTGHRLSGLWRAPGGRTTQSAIRWAANCGYPLHVHWDQAGFIGDELPSDKYPNDRLLKQALERIRPGTIAMMHLGIWSRREPLAPILEPLIQGLKSRGYCFAPLAAAQR
jgi:peptidoglycan/xylan/chitin deacetylase (PgdA/CDA1 family)